MSKYAALGNHLRRKNEKVVILSFSEIERIIGAPLPGSATAYRQWWANSPNNHPQARAWTSAGYTVVSVQLGKKGFVTFRKPGSGFWERILFGS